MKEQVKLKSDFNVLQDFLLSTNHTMLIPEKTILNLLFHSLWSLSLSLSFTCLLICRSIFPSPLCPSFILPSLSLPSPDDSRTPALAQTWPTLMWNTRCAKEGVDVDIVEGGRGGRESWLSVHFQSNQLKQNAIQDQLFPVLIWLLSHAKHFSCV